MASLIRDPRSPYWVCVVSAGRDGQAKRIWRTTKVRVKPLEGDKNPDGTRVTARELRAKAEAAAGAIEAAIRLEQQGEITEANLRRILSQALERVEGRRLEQPTIAEWLEQWIQTRKGAVGERTLQKYRQVTQDFLASLGRRAKLKLESIGITDVLKFRDELLAEGRTPQTVDQSVRKVLGSPFRVGVKLGMMSSNPLASLPPLKSTRIEKGVFTPEELSKLVAVASDDWKGVILTGYFTGARLKDVCSLRWGNVELEKKVISFRAGKTGRLVTVAIHPELEEHLLSLSVSDDSQAFLFPSLAGKRGTGTTGLSMTFKRIMESARVEAGIARQSAGTKGRTFSLRSFHSLRHSFISALANSGVSSELRRKLSGHASEEMHELYTHHELETIRSAVNAIPRLPLVGKGK